MIVAPTDSFYMIQAEGEVAELITGLFSQSTMMDVEEVQVVSKEFSNDIEPTNVLDECIRSVKAELQGTLNEDVQFNPLFVPTSIENLDDALLVDQKSDIVLFSGMDGNPFILKSVSLTDENDNKLVQFTVSYVEFNLPGYEFIVEKQKSLLN